jgi:uncharacterized protein (TIGR02246 family)
MWRLRGLVTTVVVGVVAGGWWLYAQGISGASAKALTGGDIAEIQQLYARYNQSWDFRDVELYLSVYTDDAVFTTGAGEVYAGKKALKDYLTKAFAAGTNADGTHNNTSIVITATADGAKGRGYWTVMNVMAQPPVVSSVGYYNDTFVKSADGWRIKSRTSTRGWAKRTQTQ